MTVYYDDQKPCAKNHFRKFDFYSFLRFSRKKAGSWGGFFLLFQKLEDMAHPTVIRSFRNNQNTGGFYGVKHGTPSLFLYVNLKESDRKRTKTLPI